MSLTFSKLYIKRACPGMTSLPSTDEKHEGQDEGQERHDEWETAIGAGNVPEVLVERWPGLTWRAEVAFAYDVSTDTARELGVGIKRQYGELRPFEVAGTVDVIGVRPEAPDDCGLVVVVDRKSFDPNVERASKNAQIHAGALAACRAYDIGRADIAIHHEVRAFDVESLDTFELESFAAEMRGIVVNSARELNPGTHCRWCSAFHHCPEQAKVVSLVKSGATDIQVEMMLPLGSDEGAAQAFDLLQRLEMLTKRVRSAVYARGAERPFALSNGNMFGTVIKNGNEVLDPDIVYTVVKDMHGQAIADAAVERKASKTKLKEALAFGVGKGAVASAERKVLDEVRARGGSERKERKVVEEYPAQLTAGGK